MDNHIALNGKHAVNYAEYQDDIYRAGVLHGKVPVVTMDPNKLEGQAKAVLPPGPFNYVAGGAGERATMDANRLAFRQWKVVPRFLRPGTEKNVKVELFGKTYDTPVLMAPIGVQTIFHEDREIGLAEACAEIGVPFILSTAASSSLEEVATANGDGDRWFQLYWPEDDDVTQSLLQRAKASGFKVLVVTLDTWKLAWRPADPLALSHFEKTLVDAAYVPFFKGIGNKQGFTDPVFGEKFEKKFGCKIEDNIQEASQEWIKTISFGRSHTWEDLKLLKQSWDGPVVLKGIQHPEDAKLALQYGCDGIIVSNHGGRQLDGAVGSLEMLPEIVEAVGKDLTVLFDSDIRTGADIIKALALGAKAVLIGRPVVYGLAVAGKKGAKAVLQGLLADFDQSLALAGIHSVEECNTSVLRKIQYGGDSKSSN